MSTALEQGIGTVTIGVEPFSGSYDGQGKPSYNASQDIDAQARIEDRLVRDRDGSEVRTSLTLWIDSGESPLPAHEDRVTHDGTAYIVIDRKRVTDVENVLDHVRCHCREE